MTFLHWIGEWWTALVFGPAIVVTLLYFPIYIRRKPPNEAYMLNEAYMALIMAEFIFPSLILTETPIKELLPLGWMIAICLLSLMLVSITMYFYARTMRTIGQGKKEPMQDGEE